MSEGDKNKNRKGNSLRESQYNASAESFDITCNVCDELGKHVGANGYCTDCSDYLCNDCITHHRALRATRRHTIQDEHHMPKDAKQIPLPNMPATDCTEQCSKHPSKTIEYFCSIHDALACNVDVTIDHVTCGVGYIPELAKGIASSDEMKDLRTALNEINQQSQEVEDSSTEAIASTKINSQAYTDAVNQTGDELIEHIQNLVRKAITEKDEFVKQMLDRMNRSVEISRQARNEVKQLNENIDEDNTSESQLFVHLKSSKSRVTNWRANLTTAKLDVKPVDFSYKESADINKLKDINSLGELEKRIRLSGQYEDTGIKLPDDKEECLITDLHVMPDGRVVLVDCANESVKLVNGGDKQIQQIKLPGTPWGITQTDTGDLVVTLPEAQQLQFLKVDDDLHLNHVIKTNFAPYTIDSYQDKLLVSSSNEVMVLGKDGTHIRTIHTGDHQGKYVDLSFNPNTSMLYVSDLESKEVKCLTMEGQVKGTYKAECDTWHTTVLDDGSVLVIAEDGIHHITATGNRIQMLTDWEEMGTGFAAISYVKDTGKLYLAKTILRVMQLE